MESTFFSLNNPLLQQNNLQSLSQKIQKSQSENTKMSVIKTLLSKTSTTKIFERKLNEFCNYIP